MYSSKILFLVAVTLAIQFTYSVPIEPEDADVVDESECDAVWEPVCASDRKTYANECYLMVEQRKRNPNLRVEFQGVCLDASEIVCAAVWKPVCGTDGKTYSNSCYLYVEFLETENPTLRVKHQGECANNDPEVFVGIQ